MAHSMTTARAQTHGRKSNPTAESPARAPAGKTAPRHGLRSATPAPSEWCTRGRRCQIRGGK
eukprot:3486655-Lingulodinium_polyedra.AAC.1